MDSGKKAALTKVNWKATKSCGNCHFGRFESGQDWGICGAKSNDYIHNKHQREHRLPAYKGAVCDKFCVGDNYDNLREWLSSPLTS